MVEDCDPPEHRALAERPGPEAFSEAWIARYQALRHPRVRWLASSIADFVSIGLSPEEAADRALAGYSLPRDDSLPYPGDAREQLIAAVQAAGLWPRSR